MTSRTPCDGLLCVGIGLISFMESFAAFNEENLRIILNWGDKPQSLLSHSDLGANSIDFIFAYYSEYARALLTSRRILCFPVKRLGRRAIMFIFRSFT